MIFSKEKTVQFFTTMLQHFEGQIEHESLGQIVALYQEDPEFMIKDLRTLSIVLTSMNTLSPHGECFNYIFHTLTKQRLIECIFDDLLSIRDFLYLFHDVDLSQKNRQLMLDWLVLSRIACLVCDRADVIECIILMALFLKPRDIKAMIQDLREDQFYYFSRCLGVEEEIDKTILDRTQLAILESWRSSTERHHFNKLQQFLNALIFKDQIRPFREQAVLSLKQDILARIVQKELTHAEGHTCLSMIKEHEHSLMLRCRHHQFKENEFEPASSTQEGGVTRVALLDIDLTLMKTTRSGNMYNLNLIEALKQTGLDAIYLFSDMGCLREIYYYREQLIDFLSTQGIRVLGVLTPLDIAFDLDIHVLHALHEKMIEEGRIGALNDRVGALIFNRLIKGFYPSCLGRAYQERLDLLRTLPVEAYEEFDGVSHYAVELIRKLVTLIADNALLSRQIYHVKGFLFEQFLKYNPQLETIYVFDDVDAVLLSVENVYAQGARRGSLSTIPISTGVPFESIPIDKYVRKILYQDYRKYSGRGARFLFKFSQLPIVSMEEERKAPRTTPIKTRDTMLSLASQYIHAETEEKSAYQSGLKMMLLFSMKYYPGSLSAQIAYLIKKFPEFREVLAEEDKENTADVLSRK